MLARRAASTTRDRPPIGDMLRRWRAARHLSQLDLALEAEVSARHLSFIETGRAQPSRQMVLLLSSALDVPLRERNALLNAAGFAPAYRETGLDDPPMAEVRQALEMILRQHEPFPSVVLDRAWNMVMVNGAYARFLALLLGPRGRLPPFRVLEAPRLNAVRLLFEPDGLKAAIGNWEAVARAILVRLQREAVGGDDPAIRALLDEVLASPHVPPRWREPDLDARQALIIPVELGVGPDALRFFTTLTTLGSPQDVTLQELRIESFHAADAQTERRVRSSAPA
jgi:transcriptional regulator with XRE-family HTH domain